MTGISWPDVLDLLARGGDLDDATAGAAMRAMMSGEASPAHIGAFLLALRTKGETVEEITGMARVMREFSLAVDAPDDVVDTCGTGGDRAGTVNVSTMAALVVAGTGVRVAKHGNRAASSACGSADLLEALGVVIDLQPDGVAACIEEAGIGFCFAPVFHPAMRHVAPVRRELGVRTVFNFLGPLTNPAGARRQTVGVSDVTMAPKVARALASLGATRAMVFRGEDGLDELSTAAPSRVWEVGDGAEQWTFDPRDLGLPPARVEDLAGGDAQENARICEELLAGGTGPVADVVALNAGAALVVAGVAADLADGLDRARSSLRSGAAAAALRRLREISQRLQTA